MECLSTQERPAPVGAGRRSTFGWLVIISIGSTLGGGKSDSVGESGFDLDPRDPLFFVSYGHPARMRSPLSTQDTPDHNITEFFTTLSADVAELVGRPAGADPGFLDRAMSSGVEWERELLRAAGRCQVFIPLVSSALIGSAWCATEWAAFARRRVLNRATRDADGETAILPVIWSPVAMGNLPKKVQRIQRFTPYALPDSGLTARYEREGMYGLKALGLDGEYRAVVWRLAQRVIELHRSHWVTPTAPEDIDTLGRVSWEEES
jgi:hypothetical protein